MQQIETKMPIKIICYSYHITNRFEYRHKGKKQIAFPSFLNTSQKHKNVVSFIVVLRSFELHVYKMLAFKSIKNTQLITYIYIKAKLKGNFLFKIHINLVKW
jgi:hypothetical protein